MNHSYNPNCNQTIIRSPPTNVHVNTDRLKLIFLSEKHLELLMRNTWLPACEKMQCYLCLARYPMQSDANGFLQVELWPRHAAITPAWIYIFKFEKNELKLQQYLYSIVLGIPAQSCLTKTISLIRQQFNAMNILLWKHVIFYVYKRSPLGALQIHLILLLSQWVDMLLNSC